MLLLSKEDIQKALCMKDAIEINKEAYRVFSRGDCDVPLRTNIQAKASKGNFLFMPAYSDAMKAASIKMINIFPDNDQKKLPTAPAQVLLMDGETGMFQAVIDGTYLTQLRTGAASGVALDVFGRSDAKKGALIGTGSQAGAQLEAMLAVRSLDSVKIYSRNRERLEAFVREMAVALKAYGTQLIAVESANEAIEDADLIIAVTSSTEPVFDGNKVKRGATLSFIGSYQPHMQEMDPVLLKRASKIYFDSLEAVLSEAGDILKPLETGDIEESDFTGDIGEVLIGTLKSREDNEEIIVFKSVGIAVQDLVTAKAVYENAFKHKIGMKWGCE